MMILVFTILCVLLFFTFFCCFFSARSNLTFQWRNSRVKREGKKSPFFMIFQAFSLTQACDSSEKLSWIPMYLNLFFAPTLFTTAVFLYRSVNLIWFSVFHFRKARNVLNLHGRKKKPPRTKNDCRFLLFSTTRCCFFFSSCRCYRRLWFSLHFFLPSTTNYSFTFTS